MLHIILESSAKAGSRRLCREMVAASLSHPSSSFIVLVPEQSTLQMQRQVVQEHPSHAVFSIDIVSFERLAHKVFEELGHSEADILNDTGKVLLLRKVLEDVREDLVLYKRKVSMPGFAEEMKSAFTELKQYAIDDNQLFLMQEAAEAQGDSVLFQKLQDIRLIYRKFNEQLEERYTTQEEVLEVFARLAGQSRLLRGTSLYLDGFTGFTPVQYQLLVQLLQVCAEMTVAITLPYGQIHDSVGHSQFDLSNQTLHKLRETAERAGVEVVLHPETQEQPLPKGFVFPAADPLEEVRFVAGRILEGVQSGKNRFRDYAVICSDMETYHHLLRDTLDEAQIAYFIDYKEELGDNALARFLIAAMQVITERYSYDSVFAYLKTDMTELTLDEVGELENYCLEFGIRGAGMWSRDFIRNRTRYTGTDKEDSVFVWDLEEMNRIRRKAVAQLTPFTRRCKGEHTAEDYANALENLMEGSGAKERMLQKAELFYSQGNPSKGKEYEQIYAMMTELLEQMAKLMGTEILPAREFTEILAGALDEIKVGIIPPTLDAVSVGDLTRTRLGEVKTLFFLGVNDGKVPAPPTHAGLFTQREREFLKQERFELAPTALESLYTQHFYLYLLMTRPEEELYLTYPRRSMEGEEELASYVIEGIGDILPDMQLCPVPAKSGILWSGEAARELAAGVRDRGREPDNRTQELLSYFAQAEPRVLEQILAGAFYQNRPLPLDRQTVIDLYGEVLRGSVSRYETFYACPFRHFANYGLRLKERPEYQVQATDIGTLYHDSLEKYSVKLKEQGYSFRDVTDEVSREIVREAVAEAAAGMESDVMMSTERSAYLLKRMAEVTEKTTDVLRMQVQQGLYEPEAFELSFQNQVDDGQVFQGKIDRVDLYDGGDLYVKIIDYKSGAKKFNIRDIYTGQQLQLTAYLSAAARRVQEQHPDRKVKVGGVYYYLIQDRFVRSEKEAEEKFRMSGLTNCDPVALQAIDLTAGSGMSSKIAELHYTRNGLGSRSKVANDEEFVHLMAFADGKIREVGRRVREGDVAIHPLYENGTQNACTYCDYRNICKFEPGKWGSDYRKLPESIKTEDMEKEIYGRNQVDSGAAGSN